MFSMENYFTVIRLNKYEHPIPLIYMQTLSRT